MFVILLLDVKEKVLSINYDVEAGKVFLTQKTTTASITILRHLTLAAAALRTYFEKFENGGVNAKVCHRITLKSVVGR